MRPPGIASGIGCAERHRPARSSTGALAVRQLSTSPLRALIGSAILLRRSDLHERSHPCRTSVAREAHRELDSLRHVMPRNRFSISGGAFCRLRPAASSRSCAGPRTTSARSSRASTSCALSPSGQACQTVPFVRPGGDILLAALRLAQGRTRAADYRRRRGARHRSGRRRAGLLAPRPQPSDRRRGAARLHARPASRLAASAEDRAMSAPRLILAMALARPSAVGYPGLTAMPPTAASGTPPPACRSVSTGRQSTGRLDVTDLVAVEPPEPLATFLADRGYLPRGVPLLKRVLALPGQTVCRDQAHHHGRRHRDGRGARARPRRAATLPVWQGCRLIAAGEVFLMNWQVRDSLDGRYFGLALRRARSSAARVPLWTDETATAASNGARQRVERATGGALAPPDFITAPLKNRRPAMPQIGEFTRTEDRLFRAHSDAQPRPGCRDRCGRGDRNRERAGLSRPRRARTAPRSAPAGNAPARRPASIVSIQLDDPTFAQPIRANLFRNGDDKTSWSLHWARPRDRSEKD